MLGSIPINLPNHCIDPNGFNKGRDNLTKAFIAAAKAKNSPARKVLKFVIVLFSYLASSLTSAS